MYSVFTHPSTHISFTIKNMVSMMITTTITMIIICSVHCQFVLVILFVLDCNIFASQCYLQYLLQQPIIICITMLFAFAPALSTVSLPHCLCPVENQIQSSRCSTPSTAERYFSICFAWYQYHLYQNIICNIFCNISSVSKCFTMILIFHAINRFSPFLVCLGHIFLSKYVSTLSTAQQYFNIISTIATANFFSHLL